MKSLPRIENLLPNQTRDCIHDTLARSCVHCELENCYDEIKELEQANTRLKADVLAFGQMIKRQLT